MSQRRALLAVVASLGACGSFEDESVVLDLRVLAMRTQTDSFHADMVLDVDLESGISAIAAQLEPTTVTALISDPDRDRSLAWSMTMCLPDDDGRCDLAKPHVEFGRGLIDDPELAPVAQIPTAEILPGDTFVANTMVAMILKDVEENPVTALGGVNLVIQLEVNGPNEPAAEAVYATKKLRISPRIPIDRAPNTNPTLVSLDQDSEENVPPGLFVTTLNFGREHGRCRGAGRTGVPWTDPDAVDFYEVADIFSGQVVTLFPVEDGSTRETYVTPGLDGSSIEVDETISYQWLATDGSWSDDTTGGGRDLLGNQSPLGSDWRAPNLGAGQTRDVTLWMVQRDERLGTTWLEGCFHVIGR